VSNLVVAPVGADGEVDLNNGSSGTVQLIADVSGWFAGAVPGIRSMASDDYGYCAVISTGGVDCWGDNSAGELGNGTTGGPDAGVNEGSGYNTPQLVNGVTKAASVASNSDGLGYCAVLSTGRVDCWGDNTWGELGNGTTGGPDDNRHGYNTPQAVTGITEAVALANDGLGYCAVLSTGRVDCWGENAGGELGNGTTGGPDGETGYNTPQAVTGITKAASVASDGDSVAEGYCAVLSTGGMDCWGDNSSGELGNGTTGGPDAGGYDTPQAVTGMTKAVSATNDGEHAPGYCALLSTGGMDCWGDNQFGELGNGTTGGPDGNNGYDTPQAVTGITNALSITSDTDGYCAVLSTGGLDCWGNNTYGNLGNGTTVASDVPVAVTGISTAGSSAGDTYGNNCAVLSTGGLDCWGDNSAGELGNGTTGGPDAGGYDTPQATGITNAVSAISQGAGYGSYCAVLSTGGLDCWGDNQFGELGNGITGGPDGNNGYDTPQVVFP